MKLIGCDIINKLIKARKKIYFYTLIQFFAISCIYLTISFFLQVRTNTVKKAEILKSEETIVKVESNVLSTKINTLISDLLYIADSFENHNGSYDSIEELKSDWKNFADRKTIYDQIRFIDINGYEKIRVNYFESGSIIVNEEGLTNKKDRYYFFDTIALKKNEVYISKLDLNVENNIIEQPIKPMIRLSIPVYDKQDRMMGIVILNYYAKNLLQIYNSLSSIGSGDSFLLNSNGYWIINSNESSKEWTFMYEDKKDVSFKAIYPEEWTLINKNKSGTIKTDNGYFIYSEIIPIETENNKDIKQKTSIILGEGNWYNIKYFSKDCKYSDILFPSLSKSYNVKYLQTKIK